MYVNDTITKCIDGSGSCILFHSVYRYLTCIPVLDLYTSVYTWLVLKLVCQCTGLSHSATHTRTHAHTLIFSHSATHTHTHTHSSLVTLLHTHTHTHTHTHSSLVTLLHSTRTRTHTHAHAHTLIFSHSATHTHTHAHAHTLICTQLICTLTKDELALAEQIMNNLLGRQVDSNYMVRMYCIRGLGNMADIGGSQVSSACFCT